MDIIKALETRAFASRLKRIVEYLGAEVKTVYREFGVEIEPSWLPFLTAIGGANGISIKEISESTGVSHSAVSQVISQLKTKKMVTTIESESDKRIQLIEMTDIGREAVKNMTPVCDAIKEETEKRFAKTGYDILDVIDKLESKLTESSLSFSIIEAMKDKKSDILIEQGNNSEYLEQILANSETDFKKRVHGTSFLSLKREDKQFAGIFYRIEDKKLFIIDYYIENSFDLIKSRMVVDKMTEYAKHTGNYSIVIIIEHTDVEKLNYLFGVGFSAGGILNGKLMMEKNL